MSICRKCLSRKSGIVYLILVALAGCAPPKYLSPTGKELVFEEARQGQAGTLDASVAQRCLEGDAAVFRKFFGGRHNPCAELGIYLINNGLPEEGIPLLEKGMGTEPSYNASTLEIDTAQVGVMQRTRLANLLFDACLNNRVTNLDNGGDITANLCATAGKIFEKIQYRENAVLMYRKQCELSGNCADLNRLKVPIAK